jgi:tetratricopeptide (TPR) repeat protein
MTEKSGDKDELVKALYFSSVVHFMYGNLSKAEELIVRSENTAFDLYRIPWAARSRFFRGRLRFEMGRYRDALELFDSLKGIIPPGPGKDTLAAWIFRTNVYLALSPVGESRKTIKAPDFTNALSGQNNAWHTDAGLILVETAFLLGKFDDAVKLCENYLPDPGIEEDNFFFTEQPDWKSGFSQCEAIFIPARTYRNRMISIYQMLAQCHLSPADKLSIKAENLIREYQLSEWDTNNIFYLYALHLIQMEAGASRSGISTLNMAYRRLRTRAECIESRSAREDYVSLNFWNNALYLAARENKLV